MNVSPNELRRLTVSVLQDIDRQIDEVKQAAAGREISPAKLRDTNGSYVLSPLLLGKVQALAVLVQLNEPSKKR